jgi:hypothetical protein
MDSTVALLPVLPTLWFATLFARNFGEMDELERKIQLEALAFAFSAAVILQDGTTRPYPRIRSPR